MHSNEQLINAVIVTLETIPVSGSDNMKKMLGSIEALKQLKDNLQGGEETSEVVE